MPKAHTENMLRQCGATTIVTGQSGVTIGGLLWAVSGDENSHKPGGALIPSATDVWIEGRLIIIHAPDAATPDTLHPLPLTSTAEGFDDVTVY